MYVYDGGYDAYINVVVHNLEQGIGAAAHNFKQPRGEQLR